MMAELSTQTLPPTTSVWDYEYEHNDTGCPEFDSLPVTLYSFFLTLCLLGLVGNGIILWFLGFCMKRNPFTVYILNLAVVYTVFLLCSVVFLVANMVGYLLCDNPTFIYTFPILCLWTYSTSLYLLTAISTERCVSVLYPIWHRSRRPRHLSAIVSALLLALSCLLCCSMVIFCQDLTNESCFASLLNVFVVNVLIFSPIMVLSSLTLFIKVQRSSQQRPPGKLYAVILLTVLFFLFITIPQCFVFFLSYLDIDMFCALACASSSISPLIYFVVGSYGKRRFCGSLKLALQRVFEEQKDSGEDRDPPIRDPIETAV
ncbi:proto-oncogene Mas-like [Pelodiscus sinensis]|uniref:Proto-oncogene Mas-like n=1 Tax=Pelodiscus sinensis TaxID=13735 RepID=K7EZD5_PELSI|nr:proto-oncogene Mas-like [Pelodiscus sinensis]XP_014432947.1 proto-oncogene Mas-like [Pelodiscus sinensis]|eukprot:XP_006110378.1 proto-oncogene Mas-like [Pelodiscus sinensis]